MMFLGLYSIVLFAIGVVGLGLLFVLMYTAILALRKYIRS